MRRDLANARMGQFVGPDWRTYSPAAPRIGRAEIDALVESGCPVVAYLPGGRLLWHDEDDAWPAWADARIAPQPVTGGRWESPDGATAVVLVFHDCQQRGNTAMRKAAVIVSASPPGCARR